MRYLALGRSVDDDPGGPKKPSLGNNSNVFLDIRFFKANRSPLFFHFNSVGKSKSVFLLSDASTAMHVKRCAGSHAATRALILCWCLAQT